MMQAGVRLRQDTETTLPELPEQHRIRVKEEELHGLESVHMAESETTCTAPGPNTLEPDCVTANSRVSDLLHTEASLIKKETELGPTNTGELKTESLDFTELVYVTHLHPDQIKTETDNGGCIMAEHISVLQDTKCGNIKREEVKFESSEGLVSDLMSTEVNGAGVDEEDQSEPWQCAGEPNPNNNKKSGKKQSELIRDVRIQIRRVTPPCTLHEKGFINKSDVNEQHRIHIGEKSYKCDQCQKCFFTSKHLKAHQKIHMGEKPYKCEHCEKCYSWKSHLNSHQRSHTGEKPHKCDQCEKSFRWNCHLKSHQSVHTGEKPYKCRQCEKSFSRKFYFNSHQRVHSGEKPYKCDQCEKSYLCKSHLNSHQRSHTGEKPYKCDQCERSFLRKSHLNSHERVHTRKKPFKCDRCEKSFLWKSHLQSHQRVHSE